MCKCKNIGYDKLNLTYNNVVLLYRIFSVSKIIFSLVHIFSILDFENYYKNWFLFLFSILIKLFDHEIVNCEIIHDVSMLIYILTTEILFYPKHFGFYLKNSLLLKLKTFWLKYKCFPITKVTFGLCWTCQSVGYFGPNSVEKFTFSVVQTKLLIKKFHKIISTLGNSVYSKYLFFETVLSNIL